MSRHGTSTAEGGRRFRFRRWRGTRPFWGGLLVAVGGAALVLAPLAPLPLIIQQGIAGISGYFVGLVLLVIGVLVWVQPAQRIFFGIVAILLSLASFVTSNFGGFGIGMICGLVGGALTFAWSPQKPVRARRERRRSGHGPESEPDPATTGDGDGGGDAVGAVEPDDAEVLRDGGGSESGGATRAHAFVAVPLVLALLGTPALSGWPWDDLFGGGDKGDSGTPAPPDPKPTKTPGGPGKPSASPRPGDGDKDGEDGKAGDEDGDKEKDKDKDDGGAAAKKCAAGGDASMSRADYLALLQACEKAAKSGAKPRPSAPDKEADGRFLAATTTMGLTADKLAMSGAAFDGVVKYPTKDGPRRYLRLSMDQAQFTGAEQFFRYGGGRTTLGLPDMTMDEHVVLHVTRMEARILGIKLTFTPDFPPPLLLPQMSVTDLVVDQPLAQADKIHIPELDQRVRH